MIKTTSKNDKINCPVCGNPVDLYDVCVVCNWENTGETNIDGGPNKMTLKEAIHAYIHGLPVDQLCVQH